MVSEPIDLDAIEAILADPLEERPWREITRALVEDLRRLCSDYDDLHDLYGTVTEQRDTARASLARVREYATAWRTEKAEARVRELLDILDDFDPGDVTPTSIVADDLRRALDGEASDE